MGSLAHGHHSPSYDLEWYVGRTGLSAHTDLQGAGGDKNTQGPHPQGPQASSHTEPCWKKEKSPLPQGDPPACQKHGSNSCLTPASTFSSRSCQLSHVTSTGLSCGDTSLPHRSFPRSQGSRWAGMGQGTGAGQGQQQVMPGA